MKEEKADDSTVLIVRQDLHQSPYVPAGLVRISNTVYISVTVIFVITSTISQN
jgi:hypothetical protein